MSKKPKPRRGFGFLFELCYAKLAFSVTI
ncbi:hypothetical protein EFO53_02405 [Lacticaseibacillus rhamnosus]|uniref:Uncharacterized protein n=1 Tax=Lacticaseibacillus rhamnosus TaxID=47715 RepID=A0AAP8LXA7_LACRH|nr:hypothetical protein DU507_08390 [Lacticaseibacillus rhamnosus GG]AZZ24506.1 hypothetical protein CYG41_08365 [Lacticaseibacillus rhamnosus]MBB1163605.1 hypothetical protein [Lacticaseibacillus rhamnosus]MCT3145941.1 hypothetical protein [Lacticaseibacillus rhamnosus]MCT3146798.1 hypothetical protein [Lacticaseibacillus rhamnosus]